MSIIARRRGDEYEYYGADGERRTRTQDAEDICADYLYEIGAARDAAYSAETKRLYGGSGYAAAPWNDRHCPQCHGEGEITCHETATVTRCDACHGVGAESVILKLEDAA